MTLPNGQPLPTVTAKTLEGETVDVKGMVAGGWGVVLFYRGHW